MPITPTILIVEDNWEVRELLKVILSSKGFAVQALENGREAVDFCEDHPPDAVILDLTLPDIDGLDVCKKVKSFPQMSLVPIIVCSARTHVTERAKAFEAGANDFLPKPFDPEDLVARIHAHLKRAGQDFDTARKPVQSGSLRLDPKTYQILISNIKAEGWTPREFDILYLLVRRSPETVSRQEISTSILAKNHTDTSRVIDMHIAQIRKKLGEEIAERILTIPGKGYLWSK